MGRALLTIGAIMLTLGCSSIIDDFTQVPGDGPSTDSGDAGTESNQDAGAADK